MSRFVLSPRAQADLDEIWGYTAQRWGTGQAERYIRLIGAVIHALADQPGRGKRCDNIREGYWKLPAGSHVVFYRHLHGRIEVGRILHNRMDFERHFE
jgi:toxin ParE1/3/4